MHLAFADDPFLHQLLYWELQNGDFSKPVFPCTFISWHSSVKESFLFIYLLYFLSCSPHRYFLNSKFYNPLLLKLRFLDQRCQHDLQAAWKCKSSNAVPHLLIRILYLGVEQFLESVLLLTLLESISVFFFWCSNCPRFAQGKPLQTSSVFSWYVPISLWVIPCLREYWVTLYFPYLAASDLKLTISPRNPSSFSVGWYVEII